MPACRHLVATAAVVALVVSGCTGSDEEPEPEAAPTLAALPDLDPLWTADLGGPVEPLAADVGATGSRGALTTWTLDDELVLISEGAVTGLAADDGTVGWTWEVPADLGPVCRAATPDDAGLAALWFGTDQDCHTLGLFDLATHELRWSRDLGEPYGDIGDDITPADANVFVGPERVVVPTFCDGVLALSTATGERLASDLATERDDGCGVHMQISGSTGVVTDQRGKRTRVSVRDLTTGQVLWQAPLEGEVEQVVSTDPVVLEVRRAGHRLMQRYDDTGAFAGYVGFDGSNPPHVQGLADGVVAVSYDLTGPLNPGATYQGFDVETGERVWRTGVDEAFVLGRAGDDLLLAGDSEAQADGDRTLALGRAGFDDPLEQAGIGTIALAGQWGVDYDVGWTDDVFLVLRDGELTAYPLAADADAPLPQGPVDAPAYAEGDVSGEQTRDLCRQVPLTTLATLGIERGDLPPPSGCSWVGLDPDSFRTVYVEIFPSAPSQGATGEENAQKTLEQFLADDLEQNPDYGPTQPVPGVGDEAHVSTQQEKGRDQARLMARWHNVVFVITAISDSVGGDGAGAPSLDALRGGVGQIVVDLVTELDETS